MNTFTILIAFGSMILGAIICFLGFRYHSKGLLRKAEEEAEVIKKNKIIEAKEKFIALKLEHENQVRQAEQKLHQQE
jgi:ribonuclease Y